MQAATERAEDLSTGIDPSIRNALYAIRLAEQDAYPTTIRTEVIAARDALRSAVSRDDRSALDAQLVLLGRLGKQGIDQFAESGALPSSGIVRPSRR